MTTPKPNGFRDTLLFPLQAAEELIRAPVNLLRDGMAQLTESAQQTGLPKIPPPSTVPGSMATTICLKSPEVR